MGSEIQAAEDRIRVPKPRYARPLAWAHGEVQIALTNPGGATADSGRLVNFLHVPIVVQSLHWRARLNLNGESGFADPGGLVVVTLRLGKHEVTHRPTPLWNFAPTVQDASANIFNDYTGGNAEALTYYRWVLPKALILRPGMSFSVEYAANPNNLGTLGAPTPVVNIDMVVQGYTLDEDSQLPVSMAVPFVGIFNGIVSGNTGGAGSYQESIDSDLVNPFNGPLYAQRFIGRLADANFPLEAIALAGLSGPPGAVPVVGSEDVQITDSLGNKICDFSRFYTVFDVNRRAFTFNGALRPGNTGLEREMYKVVVRNMGNIDGNSVAPQISMIGWREEPLS